VEDRHLHLLQFLLKNCTPFFFNPRLLVSDVQGDNIYVVICDPKCKGRFGVFLFLFFVVGKWNNMCVVLVEALVSLCFVFSTLKLKKK
jgi:hypothetical protein